MAKMYGQLPSYVRDNATVYDMIVTNTLLAWENEQYQKANGQQPAPNLSQEQMLAMLKSARSQ